MQSRDRSVLEHIEKYCHEINTELDEIDHDKEKYNQSAVYRNSLAFCVLQIGELVGLLTDEYKELNKNVDWRAIKGMRNIVAHKHGSFDFDVLWEAVTEDIPDLQRFCQKELNDEE